MALDTRADIALGDRTIGLIDKAGVSTAIMSSTGHGTDCFLTGAGGTAQGVAPGNTTTGAVPTSATTGAAAFDVGLGGTTNRLVRATSYCEYGILYDRVWHAGGFTPAAQSYSAAGWTGTTVVNRPSSGEGLELYAAISAATGAVTFNLTISYTNSAGTSGRSTTAGFLASAPLARCIRFPLAAGDTGIRSIQDITCSAATTGSFVVFIARPLALLPTQSVGVSRIDLIRSAVDIPSNACLSILSFTASTVTPVVRSVLEIAVE